MDNFDLIKSLNKKQQLNQEDTPKNKIKYQQYDVDIVGECVSVLIPVRECANFENILSEVSTLTKKKLKEILSMHRGFVHTN